MQSPKDARPRLYCCAEHRLEARRRRRREPDPNRDCGLQPTAPTPPAQQPALPAKPPAQPPTLPAQPPFKVRAAAPVPRGDVDTPARAKRRRPTPGAVPEAVLAWRLGAAHRWLLSGAALVTAVALIWQAPGDVPAQDPGGGASAAAPESPQPTGLIAAMRSSHDVAATQLRQTQLDLAETERVVTLLSASPASTTAGGAARLEQARRRQAQLTQNRQVFEQNVSSWITYVRVEDEYTSLSDDLVHVTAALRELKSVSPELRPDGTQGVIAGLERQRGQLEEAVHGAAVQLTRLAFAAPGETITPAPIPEVPGVSDAGDDSGDQADRPPVAAASSGRQWIS